MTHASPTFERAQQQLVDVRSALDSVIVSSRTSWPAS